MKTYWERYALVDMRQWQDTVAAFIKRHPQYEPKSDAYKRLDVIVKRLQASAATWSDPAILDKAHAIYVAETQAAEGNTP